MSLSHTADRQTETRRISVTPVRNEAWIIDLFTAAAKSWATDVIVADQGSTDGTLERLQRTPGVQTVINDSPVFDERYRQQLLLTHARRIAGRRILIGLDADEALSANFATSDEWRRLDTVAPGTILRFRWVNILPGFEQAWIPHEPRAFGFVDDGSPHEGRRIHSPRVPQPPNAPVLDFEEVVVLHFQYVAWERMVSKQRWYQMWEYVHHQQKGPLQIFREYNHMRGSWGRDEIFAVQPEWIDGYQHNGIDFRALKSEPVPWWDVEVLRMLQQYGADFFRRIDIWDKDWAAVAASQGSSSSLDFSDPRSPFERIAHRLLKATQHNRSNLMARGLEWSLRVAGW
jgi:hypothetical protein